MKKIIWILIYLLFASNIFSNPTKLTQLSSFGFSIETPVTWSDVTTGEFKENLQRVHLGSPTFTKLLHEKSEIPIYSIRKGDPEIDEFLPTLNVKIQKNNLEFNNIPNTLRKLLFYISIPLKNFDYLVEPKTVRINGNLAGYSLFSYSIFNENEVETKVVSAVWIFPQKDYFYFIGSGIPYENFEPTLEEVKSIVETVKINAK
ncbi:hypothetical protein [Leptospira perdikensis]|uniref:Uncharacterized protein n=1 Tax=Leptospira perdikensis TaxID=2484948 RepID=A0A4R9JL91_9LEPT|nr:hypothetical protein [Leptospira perdikensis]TGL44631.1 hypothetical protein EHQ49_03925 [Leptospira perdikensis]